MGVGIRPKPYPTIPKENEQMKPIPTQCDVVVIGGGPAGSVAATLLAQKGHKVTLLEKQQHPRYMVGESLIPDFWKYTDLIGASAKIEAEGFITKAGGLINWNNQPRAHNFKDFGYTRPALHVERDRFDYILLNHARSEGVQVFEEVAVSGVNLERDADGYVNVAYRVNADKSSGNIGCRYVVDASGQSSVIGRQLGLREVDEDFRFMSVWGYFENSRYFGYDGQAYTPDKLAEVQPTTYVTSIEDTDDAGWCWHIMLRANASVGLVLPLHRMKEAKGDNEDWEAFFLRETGATPILRDLLKDATFIPGSLHMTRDYSYRLKRIAGPSYFLVGDAGGFVDPIFSVGCVMSFYAAYAGAWAVDRCLNQPEAEEAIQALFARQVEGRLEIARSLALPRYRAEGQASDLARSALQLQRSQVQELMQVVSTLTTRSENFDAMLNEAGGPGGAAVKYKRFERLNVG